MFSRFRLALAVVVAALAIPAATAQAALPAGNIGDGGGGACTPAIAGQTFVMNTTMWSYAWFSIQQYWVWGEWSGHSWYCDGRYWWRNY